MSEVRLTLKGDDVYSSIAFLSSRVLRGLAIIFLKNNYSKLSSPGVDHRPNSLG